MKPTGQIDFVFDTDLLVCLGDDREDGELQVSFELTVGSRIPMFIVSGQPDTKRTFHTRFA